MGSGNAVYAAGGAALSSFAVAVVVVAVVARDVEMPVMLDLYRSTG